MNDNIAPIKRRQFIKKDNIKEDKTKETFWKAHDHWNNWKFQLHWNNLEWVYLNTWDLRKNIFCYLTHKLYIKNGNELWNYFWYSKFKPIDYVVVFKRQAHISVLTVIITSITVSKANNKASSESSKSVKNTHHEAPGKITAVNEHQEN